MKAYIARLALALDILLNTVFAGRVETISSRMGRAIVARRPCALCGAVCWLLSRFWPDHCVHNIMTPVSK